MLSMFRDSSYFDIRTFFFFFPPQFENEGLRPLLNPAPGTPIWELRKGHILTTSQEGALHLRRKGTWYGLGVLREVTVRERA